MAKDGVSVAGVDRILGSPKGRQGLQLLLEALEEAQASAPDGVFAPGAPSSPMRDVLARVGEMRGRGLYFPFLGSGFGKGARVELVDGAWKYDFICAIGPLLFGHADPDLVRTAIEAALTGPPMQGHLEPGPAYRALLETLVEVSAPRLAHAWLATSGTMANEFACKMIRQKRAPATKIVAFEGNFSGRSTLMQEITDRPGYREGQPTYGEVLYVPFHDPMNSNSTHRAVDVFKRHLTDHRGEIAALMVEFVQGEGGLNDAPASFFQALFEVAKDEGVAIWADEVQTFARTGELFAYERLDLGDWLDVVTIGKVLQGSAVLFTDAMNPKPGLVSATFAGSTVGMAVGRRIINRLRTQGYLGPSGRFAEIERMALRSFAALRDVHCAGAIDGFGAVGTMAWVRPFGGDSAKVKALVDESYRRGLMLFTCGTRAEKIRMLPPGGVLSDEEWRDAMTIFAGAVNQVAKEAR